MRINGEPDQALSWRRVEDGELAVVRFHERSLNFDFAERHRDQIKRLLKALTTDGVRGIVLDLGEVGSVDSCGIGLIIAACNLGSSRGAAVGLTGVTPFIDRTFEMMRLRRHLRIFPSEEKAVAALAVG